MRDVMTLAQAVQVKREVAIAVKKWGLQASVNYTPYQIMQAMATLHEVDSSDAQTLVDSQKTEITRLKRQLAVCLNREKAHAKRGKTQTEHVGDDEEVT